MKPVKVDNEDLRKAIYSGNGYIQINGRNYMLLEVEQIYDTNVYEVMDPEEEKQLIHALKKENPILSDEEINGVLDN